MPRPVKPSGQETCGFSTGEDFVRYMIDCFDVGYEEGAEHPKLMSLHCTTG